MIDKKHIRDYLRLISSILFCWLYLPHILILLYSPTRELVFSDICRLREKISINLPILILFLYELHTNRYFRSLFYHRIGPVLSMLISWWRPGDRYFQISYSTRIGYGFKVVHPYATVINAQSIGDNFSCLHCTTLGAKGKYKPIIGNNVILGANVLILGGVHIGDNVIIRAGSVVVKDVPENAIVVGNPGRVIKYRE